MSNTNHIPETVNANLDARLAPYRSAPSAGRDQAGSEDPHVEALRSAAPHHERHPRPRLINDLKLLFRALGAGNSVVPLGDNSRTARLLAEYANSLRTN